MSFTTSDRGFKQFEPVETQYAHVVRVYESSAAMQPCLWLAIDLDEPKNGLEAVSAHAHCSMEQAIKIRDRIDACVANHYQLEGGERSDEPVTSSESSIVLGALMDTAWLHEAIAAQTNLRPDEVKLAIEMIADVGRLQ